MEGVALARSWAHRKPGGTLSELMWTLVWGWPGAVLYFLAGWFFLNHLPRGFNRRLDHWDLVAGLVGLAYWWVARKLWGP